MNFLKKNFKIIMIGLISGIVNGLFGSGGGTIIVPSLCFLVGLEEHKSHATAISIILPLSLLSTYIYFRHSVINLNVSFYVAIGSIIGGFIGAKVLNKVPNKYLRKSFGIVMIIAAIRLVIK